MAIQTIAPPCTCPGHFCPEAERLRDWAIRGLEESGMVEYQRRVDVLTEHLLQAAEQKEAR